MDSMHNQIILECPYHLKPFRENRKTICIDSKIINVIKHLWGRGVITLGCCQGLNNENPNIVLHEGYSINDIKFIYQLIRDIDKRKWVIYQWHSRLEKMKF